MIADPIWQVRVAVFFLGCVIVAGLRRLHCVQANHPQAGIARHHCPAVGIFQPISSAQKTAQNRAVEAVDKVLLPLPLP